MPEQDVEAQVLEQTRREVNRLMAEVEHLAGQEMQPAEFYAEICRRVATGVAAQATALWIRTPALNLQLQFQINLQAAGLDFEQSRAMHDDLMRHALTQARPFMLLPYSGTGESADGRQHSNPTGYVLMIAPIILDGIAVGVLETFVDPSRRPNAHPGLLGFCNRVAGEVGRYLRNRQFRQIRGEQERWNRVDGFIRSVHGGLDPRQVAYLIANDGKKLIECERLSVGIRRAKRTRILAISGQEVVEKRSNLVQRMAKLADAVIEHGENLIYQGTVEEHWPGDVRKALTAYLEESNSKLIAILPLADTREFGKRGKAFTCLIAEMIEDGNEPAEMGSKLEVVSRHGSTALYNALEYHRIPALPVMRALGNATETVRSRTVVKWGAIVATSTLILGGILMIPWPLRLEGRGELVPENRRFVFAPSAGIVRSVKVDHDVTVGDGKVIAEMSSPELDIEIAREDGELKSAKSRYDALFRQLNDARNRRQGDSERIGLELRELEKKVGSHTQQLALLRQKKDDLQIRAPVAGTIMDWKPKEKLESRPVQQGDPLFEIADVKGPWVLEVNFPETVVARLSRARAEAPNGQLPVEFVLHSTEATYKGTLIELATQGQVQGQENTFRGKIRIDDGQKVPLKKGLEVRAKVNCGPHPLGIVLFREVIDFVREYVFF